MNYTVKLNNKDLISTFRTRTKKYKLKQNDLIEQYMRAVLSTLDLVDEIEKAGKKVPLNLLDVEFKFNLDPYIALNDALKGES